MLQTIRLFPGTLQTLAFGSISGTYALLGTLSLPAQILLVQNLTDVTLTFSQNGTTDNFVVPSNGFVLLDAGSNRGTHESLSFPEGTTYYVKGSPTMGSVYLSYWYMG